MARSLKPMKVDQVRDRKTGEVVDIMLDRDRNVFFFVLDKERSENPTAAECRQLAVKKLEERRQFTWKQVIRIDRPTDFHHGGRAVSSFTSEVKFEFVRIEIAQKPDGEWLQRPFLNKDGLTDGEARLPVANRNDDMSTRNKRERDHGGDLDNYWPPDEDKEDANVVLDYDEDIWTALCAIHDKILLAKKQLEDLLKQKDLHKKLRLVASNLKLLPEKT